MDEKLISIFSSKLKISENKLKTLYNESLTEYLSIPISEKNESKRTYCMYKFVSGENSGKTCGLLPKNSSVEVSSEIDGFFYCKSHFKTISERNKKTEKLKLVGIKNPFQTSIEKLETEKMGDFEVIKGTMLLIDRSKNCCSGKIVEGSATSNINKNDESFLVEKKIPYYKCVVENDEDTTSDIENSEEVDLNSL